MYPWFRNLSLYLCDRVDRIRQADLICHVTCCLITWPSIFYQCETGSCARGFAVGFPAQALRNTSGRPRDFRNMSLAVHLLIVLCTMILNNIYAVGPGNTWLNTRWLVDLWDSLRVNIQRKSKLLTVRFYFFRRFSRDCKHYAPYKCIRVQVWLLAAFLQSTAKLALEALYMLRVAYLSVCPSVSPSHSGIVSKRGNAEGCGLHRHCL